MKFKKFLEERQKTDNIKEDDTTNILHAVMGLITEVDEVENCKSFEVTDEVGDLLWYLYKPISMNQELLSTIRKFNAAIAIEHNYTLAQIKSKTLDSFKKVNFQKHDIEARRKDGHTHLEVFSMLFKYCRGLSERKISTYGLTEEHIFEKNIKKLAKRYDGGQFNEKLSMNRRGRK